MPKNLEVKVNSILERNKRVESDKAWETSKARRLVLAVATYVVVWFFLIVINAPNPELAALVPAGAFLLQQYSLPFLKDWWVEKVHKAKPVKKC
ncbi:MAG: hypothetical protein Q7R70_02000 [Candidatus Diapherotrites archaeon]|nr:hypothetical protein [Candidatus Diapherotrites archaeon]